MHTTCWCWCWWWLYLLVVAGGSVTWGAPLEPPVGKLLLGAWYDRNNSDSPASINQRIHYKPLPFFQVDVDQTSINKPWTAPSIVVPQLIQHLQQTNTDANAFLTIYPFNGLQGVTDAHIQETLQNIKDILAAGRNVFVRFAPEMNGSWFPYGQRPKEFIALWRKCITTWRSALGSDANRVAFVWAPNSGNGYPYPKDETKPWLPNWSPVANTTDGDARIAQMDTNTVPGLDALDDPYSPYYPGDDVVDWVGLSIYTYGSKQYPWHTNDVPEPNKFEGMMQGLDSGNPSLSWGHFPFYTMFSSANTTIPSITSGNKPFMVAETGAAYHYAWFNCTETQGCPGASPDQTTTSRIQMKQPWYRSFLNASFLERYPNFKAACLFEFVKSEEDTWRDFSTLGAAPGSDSFHDAADAVVHAFVQDWMADWDDLLVVAGPYTSLPNGSTTAITTGVPQTGVASIVKTTSSGTIGLATAVPPLLVIAILSSLQ